MSNESYKTWYTPQEFADALGIKVDTVWRWLRDGKLAHKERAGRMRLWRIPASELEAINTALDAKRNPSGIDELPEFLSPQQFADVMGVKIETVWGWLRTGQLSHLPRTHGQRLYFIPRSEVQGFHVNRKKNKNVLAFPPMPAADDAEKNENVLAFPPIQSGDDAA